MNQTYVIGNRDKSAVKRLLEQAGQDGVVQSAIEEARRRRRQEILERLRREKREKELQKERERQKREWERQRQLAEIRSRRIAELKMELWSATTEEERERIKREIAIELGAKIIHFNDSKERKEGLYIFEDKIIEKIYKKEIYNPIKKIIDFSKIKNISETTEYINNIYNNLNDDEAEDKKKNRPGNIVIPDQSEFKIPEQGRTLEDLVCKMIEDSDSPKQIKINEIDSEDLFERYKDVGKYGQPESGGKHGKPA